MAAEDGLKLPFSRAGWEVIRSNDLQSCSVQGVAPFCKKIYKQELLKKIAKEYMFQIEKNPALHTWPKSRHP